jgi:hypothetical protein
MKRERWTETDLLALPAEEPDEFDRKSGLLLNDPEKFLDAVAKAVSAFANSGGGSLILGVEDDGTLAGAEPLRGRETLKDWLEQKIPNLLDYPLSDFRVHTVEPAAASLIPEGKVVVVVDVADSALAPHQSKRDRIYYHRSAGRSLPAPHFYLELLRNRLTSASLQFELQGVEVVEATPWEGGLSIEMKFTFNVRNTGRIAAYKWSLRAQEIHHPSFDERPERGERYYFGTSNFPVKKGRSSSVSLDDTILPGNSIDHKTDVAVTLPSTDNIEAHLGEALGLLAITYRLATETSPGEPVQVALGPVVDIPALSKQVAQLLVPAD